MKVFGGAARMDYKNSTRAQIDSQHVPLALRYALSTPGVVSANLGVNTVEQIRHNVQMIKDFRPLSPEETARAVDLGRGLAAKWGEHFGPPQSRPRRDSLPVNHRGQPLLANEPAAADGAYDGSQAAIFGNDRAGGISKICLPAGNTDPKRRE